MIAWGVFLCMLITICNAHETLKLGVEQLSPILTRAYNLDSLRIGFIGNQTSVDQNGTPTLELLHNNGVNVTTIFAPEHGYYGKTPAGVSVENDIDAHTRIPIVSLYSHQKGLIGRTINEDKMNAIDALIFDMQDSGMRHYTYISTLMRCLEASALYKKPLFVLDRPNPLGGIIEGPLVEPDLLSFISIAPIPLRHGMTIGELAWYFNTHILKQPAPLHVIRMTCYNRMSNNAHVIQRPLSPNLMNAHACFGYSFLGLLGEVRPFDVGVGTDKAFQCIMLPKTLNIPSIAWYKAQHILKTHGIQSTRYTAYNERKKETLEGLALNIPDIHAVKSFQLFLQLVSLFKAHGISLTFAPTFDKAVGNHQVKLAIMDSSILPTLYKNCYKNLETFYTNAQSSFLYKPHPIIGK